MKKIVLTLFMFIMVIGVPMQANAYSYGDPNLEDVAESFKSVVAALSKATPDWTQAESVYKERRSEIASHFGATVATTLDTNFKSKNKDLVIANFKGVLLKNLDRRFTYAKQDVNNYTEAKLLLAKAKATYETLSPYIADTKKVSAAMTSFEVALDALGNPGLFGVGKKEQQPEVFKKQVDLIYNGVKPLFPFKVVSSSTSAPTPTTAKPTAKPAVQATVEPSAKPSTEPSAEPTIEPSAEPSAESSPEPSAVPTVSPDPTIVKTQPHAAMERVDKTNPVVTTLLIGFVLLIAAAGYWYMRKK